MPILDVLRDVHRSFFEEYAVLKTIPDVKQHIRERRISTLAGCHLYFSGIVPLNTKPVDCREWKYSQSMW